MLAIPSAYKSCLDQISNQGLIDIALFHTTQGMMGQMNRLTETLTLPAAHIIVQPKAPIAAASSGC